MPHKTKGKVHRLLSENRDFAQVLVDRVNTAPQPGFPDPVASLNGTTSTQDNTLSPPPFFPNLDSYFSLWEKSHGVIWLVNSSFSSNSNGKIVI